MDVILIGTALAGMLALVLGFAAAHVRRTVPRRVLLVLALLGPPLALIAFLAADLAADPRDVGQGIGMAIILYAPAILLWIVLGLCGKSLGRHRAMRKRNFR